MDVQCERCRTEYDFDDALVSGRGTTVRCTNCGHQFKVRRFEGGAPAADRWSVKTVDGHELTFFSLRDLQQAISSKRVRRADVLVQGGGGPRALGSIAEASNHSLAAARRCLRPQRSPRHLKRRPSRSTRCCFQSERGPGTIAPPTPRLPQSTASQPRKWGRCAPRRTLLQLLPRRC